jgi:hypothetical protein
MDESRDRLPEAANDVSVFLGSFFFLSAVVGAGFIVAATTI